jgi:hypothetical protein
MLYASVPGRVKTVAKSTPAVPFLIEEARGRKDWIDATICELSSSDPAGIN